MARFVRGDVVVVPFPFSSATGSKVRPALVVATWPFESSDDYLLCLISSQNAADPYIMELDTADIENGSLNRKSYIRPTYMFAVGEHRISRRIGTLRAEKLEAVINIIAGVLR